MKKLTDVNKALTNLYDVLEEHYGSDKGIRVQFRICKNKNSMEICNTMSVDDRNIEKLKSFQNGSNNK
jgi:hypothetical protein